jgi:diguanylate cyclase (GGDEF)-like protein
MPKTPHLRIAVSSGAPATTPPLALPASLSIAEKLLSLSDALVGCAKTEDLLQRFLHWAQACELGEGLDYRGEPDASPVLTLGQARHHRTRYQLTLEGEPLGQLTLTRRERYREAELLLLERALASLCKALWLARSLAELQRQARHDGLTGLLNRKSLDEQLAAELARAQRHGHLLSLMVIDVDHFKDLNDRLGHPSGDHALRTLADIFLATTRESDFCFRYGGDEFAILMPATDLAAARCTAERIRRRIRSLPSESFYLTADEEALLRPEISIGVAQFTSGDTEADLMQRADTHLYHAKARGRGRICTHV